MLLSTALKRYRNGALPPERVSMCSRGCVWLIDAPFDSRVEHMEKCPAILSYDRMSGSRYCKRKLFNLKERADKIVEQIMSRYYPPSSKVFDDFGFIDHMDCGFVHTEDGRKSRMEAAKQKVIDLLLQGYEVKGGWSGTSIPNYRDHFIFFRTPK